MSSQISAFQADRSASRVTRFGVTALCLLLLTGMSDESGSPEARRQAIEALRDFSGFVGDWKGAAQPKRGSNAGAWTEACRVAWHFGDDSPGLQFVFDPGQGMKLLKLTRGSSSKDSAGVTELRITDADGREWTLKPESVDGSSDGRKEKPSGSWTFVGSSAEHGQLRCTIRSLSEIRCALLFEQRMMETGSWRRMYELGMTRAGERLARSDAGGPVCIVTGGLGTIRVQHDGQTYYVCCEGCKQAFDADPAGTIAAYREELKQNKK